MKHLGLRGTVIAVSLTGPLVVAVITGVVSVMMFLNSHDLKLVLMLLGFGTLVAVCVALLVTGPLVRDLRQVESTVARVADGDLDARVGLQRQDDIGALADAVDDLVERRQAAERERNVVLASISHDLRTPLTALRAALEAIQDGLSPDPQRYLASMERDLDAVDDLVNDLFLLGRIEAGRYEPVPEPVQLGELIDDAVEALTPLAQQGTIDIRPSIDNRVEVLGNASGISRVVRNLLDNGIRHAPAGSSVSIDVRCDDQWALVRFVDEGPGFPDAFREEAFERFTRSDPARTRATGAAGLGLAIARGVVKAHGGRIWADPGPGGRVNFTLPLLTPLASS
jgi:two-component system sensor histidine kinase BaeS